MRAFVSGVAGLIGSHVARRLMLEGWEVVGCDDFSGGYRDNVPPTIKFFQLDCHDVEALSDSMKGTDVVFHCAALAHEGLSNFSPTIILRSIVTATSALMTSALRVRAKRFVFCSSMARYGRQKAPFDEVMPADPVDPYGIAKVSAEKIVACLADLHGIEYVIIVPHNVFGVGQRYDDPYRNVVGIMLNRILQGKPPLIYGDGSQIRSFTPIDDATSAIVRAGTADVAGEIINIGPGPQGAMTVLSLAQQLLSVSKSTLSPVFVPPRPNEVHKATCHNNKAKKLLQFVESGDIGDELERMYAWIKRRGPLPFDYFLPIEIPTSEVPDTWANRSL